MGKTMSRGAFDLGVRLKVTEEVVVRVIAEQAVRDRAGSYQPPLWCRNRTSVQRGLAKLLAENGMAHYEAGGGWYGEILADEISRATACGKAICARFFPELG